MAKSARNGSLGVRHVVAAATRTAGTPVLEQGYVGFPMNDAASGATYALDCRVGAMWEITKVGAEAKGDYIYLKASDNSLALTSAAGYRLAFKVVEAENGTVYGTPAGKTLVEIMPQSVTA